MKIVDVKDIPAMTYDVSLEDTVDVLKKCIEMEILCKKEGGIGLAAVQVGLPLKLFIINLDGVFHYYVNCEYTLIGNIMLSIEGCLSLTTPQGGPRLYRVPRGEKTRIIGKELVCQPTLEFIDVDMEAIGRYNVVFQHEIDHQNNILISDIGEEVVIKEEFYA